MENTKLYNVRKLKKFISSMMEENKPEDKEEAASETKYLKALQTLLSCLKAADSFEMAEISPKQLTNYSKEITSKFLAFVEEKATKQNINILPESAPTQGLRPNHFAEHYVGMVYSNNSDVFAPIFMTIDDSLNVSIEGFYFEYKGGLHYYQSNVYAILQVPESKDSPSFVILYTNIFGAVGYKLPIRIFIMNVNYTKKEEGTLCSDYVVFFRKPKEDFEKLSKEYVEIRNQVEKKVDEIKRQNFLKEKCLSAEEYEYGEKVLNSNPTVNIKPTYHDSIPSSNK